MGLIALGALTVTSCSNDEVMDTALQQEAQAIQFSTYLGRDVETKGTEFTNEKLKLGFGITAFYTSTSPWSVPSEAPNFMYNQKVTSTDGTNWTYTPIKYWPTMKGDKISFFAYAPYVTNTTAPTSTIDGSNAITLPAKNASENVTSLTFNLTTEAKDMVDFVAAQVIDATQKDNASGGADPVNFALKHELSRLTFEVKTSENLTENSHVVLKSAKLVGGINTYAQSATYTFANNSTSDPTNPRGTWDEHSWISSNYDLKSIVAWTAKNNIAGEGPEYNSTKIGGKVYNDDVKDLTSATAKSLFNSDEYLFLIPPAGATGLSANQAKVVFAYDIVTEDINLSAGYSCTEATKTVSLPTGILQQGKAYEVTFTFNMDQIEVSASVDPWTSENNSVEVPFTPDAPAGSGN